MDKTVKHNAVTNWESVRLLKSGRDVLQGEDQGRSLAAESWTYCTHFR